MGTRWLDDEERAAWLGLIAVVELLPAVLDGQLRRDSGITHYDYFVLAMLSEAPERTLQMTALAQMTNATLSRLSHVVRRLEERKLVERFPCPGDARATSARLSAAGLELLAQAAPGHVSAVRACALDGLSHKQVHQLLQISTALLKRLDPEGQMAGFYSRERP